MKFAYADPPYPGCAHYYLKENPNACEVDHQALIDRLVAEFPDGWALSTSTAALRDVWNMCPPEVRVAAWCKPFTPMKMGGKGGLHLSWEPVLYFTPTLRGKGRPVVGGVCGRDWTVVSPPLRQRIPGEKPLRFSWWIFQLLGAGPGDELVDLFPGSGAVTEAWNAWVGNFDMTGTLFEGTGT